MAKISLLRDMKITTARRSGAVILYEELKIVSIGRGAGDTVAMVEDAVPKEKSLLNSSTSTRSCISTFELPMHSNEFSRGH
jgi:hypothetical protein